MVFVKFVRVDVLSIMQLSLPLPVKSRISLVQINKWSHWHKHFRKKVLDLWVNALLPYSYVIFSNYDINGGLFDIASEVLLLEASWNFYNTQILFFGETSAFWRNTSPKKHFNDLETLFLCKSCMKRFWLLKTIDLSLSLILNLGLSHWEFHCTLDMGWAFPASYNLKGPTLS